MYGGDIVAMNTGAASANGGAATGGRDRTPRAVGTATGRRRTVNNTPTWPRPDAGHTTSTSNWQKWRGKNTKTKINDSYNRKKIVRGSLVEAMNEEADRSR